MGKITTAYGLIASGGHDFDAVLERKLLILVYRSPSKPLAALDLSDVKRPGQVEIRIYKEFFENEKDFRLFAKSVVGNIAKLGTVNFELGDQYTK